MRFLDLCYTLPMMSVNRQFWRGWAAALSRWGMQDAAAALLEVAGPLNFLAAQALYLGQPLLGFASRQSGLSALAQLLEEPAHTREFIGLLREAPHCEPGA